MLRRAWAAGAAPDGDRLTIDPDATRVAVYGPGKQGSAFSRTGQSAQSPLVGVVGETGDVLALRDHHQHRPDPDERGAGRGPPPAARRHPRGHTIRALKTDFGMNHAPVQRFFGNWLYWQAVALAHNLGLWLRTLALPTEYRRARQTTAARVPQRRRPAGPPRSLPAPALRRRLRPPAGLHHRAEPTTSPSSHRLRAPPPDPPRPLAPSRDAACPQHRPPRYEGPESRPVGPQNGHTEAIEKITSHGKVRSRSAVATDTLHSPKFTSPATRLKDQGQSFSPDVPDVVGVEAGPASHVPNMSMGGGNRCRLGHSGSLARPPVGRTRQTIEGTRRCGRRVLRRS